MEYRILPRTGWKVSAISFGCMSLIKILDLRSQVSDLSTGSSEHDAKRLLHKAVDLGINFFDTADIYDNGQNEITVGRALGAKRKSLYLATKVGNQMRPDGSGWDWNPRKDYILKAVEGSLKRLQTDYIDLYQLHGGTIDDPIDETVEAFELLKEQGKIRAYGISSIRPNVIREYVARSNMVSVMMQYSLLDRRPEESILPLLQKHGIGVLVRGAVAKGLLVDKPAKEYLGYSVEQVREVSGFVARVTKGEGLGTRDEGRRTRDEGRRTKDEGRGTRDEGRGDEGGRDEGVSQSTSSGRTAAQTALQFALRGRAVYSVAAGMRTEEQLNENAAAFRGAQLSEAQHQQLATLLSPNKYQAHR